MRNQKRLKKSMDGGFTAGFRCQVFQLRASLIRSKPRIRSMGRCINLA